MNFVLGGKMTITRSFACQYLVKNTVSAEKARGKLGSRLLTRERVGGNMGPGEGHKFNGG